MSEDMLYIHIYTNNNGNLYYQAVDLPVSLSVFISVYLNKAGFQPEACLWSGCDEGLWLRWRVVLWKYCG